MTEPRPPLSDEDLSAVLDGEAAPEVTEQAQADPTARTRIDAFRTAGDSLRAAPVPLLDSSVVDDLVGRALAQADTDASSTDASSTAGPEPIAGGGGAIDRIDRVGQDDATSTSSSTEDVVLPSSPHLGRSTGMPRWLVAAAIVAVVAIGLGLIWSGSDDGGSETAGPTASGSVEDQAEGGGAGEATVAEGAAEDAGGSATVPPTTAAPAEVPTTTVDGTTGAGPASGVIDLGASPTLEGLRASLAVSFPSDRLPLAPGVGPSAAVIDRCELLMMEVFDLPTGATQVGRATVDGEDLLVLEFDAPSVQDGSPTTFITVNDPTSCDARLSFERSPG